ncbi:MAG: hypothetical protein GX647_03870 [Clostridiales bacterium]|jgi:hypothetical protein|nr:hypothetical protein [Clostridiales bacterium]
MKKFRFLTLALAVLLMLSACNVVAEAADYKTGYAVLTTVGSSTSATAEADGKAAINVVFVGVLLDEAGKIAECKIDYIPAAITFTAEGKISSDPTAPVQSKQELGFDYGMKKASGIGKEWFEQADALAAYVVGKTGQEVLQIPLTQGNTAADQDLIASVTIKINPYIEGIAKACENAKEMGAKAGDGLSIGSVTSAAASKDAAADAAGEAAISSTFAVVTKDGNGVITSCVLDALNASVKFDAKGQITSDLTQPIASKNVLGDAYGMRGSSKLGLEWNEQAANFAKLTVGKNRDQILGMDLAGADVVSSATIHTNEFVAAIAKALG